MLGDMCLLAAIIKDSDIHEASKEFDKPGKY